MSILDNLTDKKKERIVSLPYRVGYFISDSDKSGGAEAKDQELQVLDNILSAYCEDIFGSEPIQHVISATVARKKDWPQWTNNIHNIPDDCAFALAVFRQYESEKDADAFRGYLIEIAEAVARAFSEFEKMNAIKKMNTYIAYGISWLRARREGIKPDSWEQFRKISPGERRALKALANALQTTYI